MLSEEETLELARQAMNDDRNYLLTPVHFETLCVIHVSYVRKEPPGSAPRPANVVDLPSERDVSLDPGFPEPFEAFPDDEPIGHAPFLVDKRTGDVIHTGTAVLCSDEHYVSAYLDCGDPCAEETNRIRIIPYREGVEKNQAIRVLHAACDLGLEDARNLVDRVIEGETVELETHDEATARRVARQLGEMGLVANQRYRGERTPWRWSTITKSEMTRGSRTGLSRQLGTPQGSMALMRDVNGITPGQYNKLVGKSEEFRK